MARSQRTSSAVIGPSAFPAYQPMHFWMGFTRFRYVWGLLGVFLDLSGDVWDVRIFWCFPAPPVEPTSFVLTGTSCVPMMTAGPTAAGPLFVFNNFLPFYFKSLLGTTMLRTVLQRRAPFFWFLFWWTTTNKDLWQCNRGDWATQLLPVRPIFSVVFDTLLPNPQGRKDSGKNLSGPNSPFFPTKSFPLRFFPPKFSTWVWYVPYHIWPFWIL